MDSVEDSAELLSVDAAVLTGEEACPVVILLAVVSTEMLSVEIAELIGEEACSVVILSAVVSAGLCVEAVSETWVSEGRELVAILLTSEVDCVSVGLASEVD